MLIGYARTSTTEQVAGLEAQIRELEAAGCEEIFQEQLSSVDSQRPKLAEALRFARKGDTVVVAKVDRLARSTIRLWEIVNDLEARGIGLRILNLGKEVVDTTSATGKLILNIFSGFAQFEREMMLERQREGIAKAKAEGKYKGRKPTVATQAEEIRSLHASGVGPAEIAKRLGVARSSVYRMLEA